MREHMKACTSSYSVMADYAPTSKRRYVNVVSEIASNCSATVPTSSRITLRALSCGLPLLSTRTAGAEELIEEGKNGLFIQDRTPEAVAKGIEHILSYDRGSLKQAAHETVSHFDIARAVKSYELLFTAVKGR